MTANVTDILIETAWQAFSEASYDRKVLYRHEVEIDSTMVGIVVFETIIKKEEESGLGRMRTVRVAMGTSERKMSEAILSTEFLK